jgi:poly(3-hydroxybutyrate) depolymerase
MNATSHGLAMAAAIAVVAATSAAGCASTHPAAPAAPVMKGHYTETTTNHVNGQTTHDDWYATPCGDGCAKIAVGEPKSPPVQAQLVNDQWSMDMVSNEVCPDGTKVPEAFSVHYLWDPHTLAGTVRTTNQIAGCGDPAGHIGTQNIQLKQVS